MTVRLSILLTALGLAACAERPPAGELEPGTAPEDAIDTAAALDSARALALPDNCDELADHVLAVHPTREAMLAAYGPPASLTSTTQPNRHNPAVTDTLYEVHYPGLQVSIHTPGGGADLPSGVIVEDNRYLAYPRIGIGAYADTVIAVLGPPHGDDATVLTYNCTMAVDQPVHFDLADGRVRRVRIEYYVD